MVRAGRVCQGQLLCKFSFSQLSLLQKKHFISRLNVNFLDSTQNSDKEVEREMKVKGIKTRCTLEEFVKDN